MCSKLDSTSNMPKLHVRSSVTRESRVDQLYTVYLTWLSSCSNAYWWSRYCHTNGCGLIPFSASCACLPWLFPPTQQGSRAPHPQECRDNATTFCPFVWASSLFGSSHEAGLRCILLSRCFFAAQTRQTINNQRPSMNYHKSLIFNLYL